MRNKEASQVKQVAEYTGGRAEAYASLQPHVSC